MGQPPTVRTGAVSVPRPRHPPVGQDASPSSASESFPRTAWASAIRMVEGVTRNGTVTPVSVTPALVRAAASSRPLATGSRHDPLTSAETIAWPATRSWPRARATSPPSATRRLRSAIGPSNGTRPSRDSVPTSQRPRIDTASSPVLVSRASPRTSPGVTRSSGGGSRACSSPSAMRASLRPASMTADAVIVPGGPSARNWSTVSRPRSHRTTAGERVVQRPPATTSSSGVIDAVIRISPGRHRGTSDLRARRDAPEHSPARRGRHPGHDGIQVGPLESGLRRDGPAFFETAVARGREPHRGKLERRRQVAARDTDVEAARPEEDAAERDVAEADRRGGGYRPPLCAGPEAGVTRPLQREAGRKLAQPAERDRADVRLRPSVAAPVPGPAQRQRSPLNAAGEALDLDPLGVEHDSRLDALDRRPGEDDARRLERSCPPREAFAARQPVTQLGAVERPRGEGKRAHVGLPCDDRPIPRSRRLRGHARRARNARRAHRTRERSEIGVEVRTEPQAGPRLHAARDVEPGSGPPRGHRPELDPAPFEPAFGLHVRRAEGHEDSREPEPVQRESGPSRAGSLDGAQGEGAPDGPAREVSANVPKVHGPVPEASLEGDTLGTKRSRGELGHGDATLDPRGGDRPLERRVEPGDAGKRPGDPHAAGDRDQAGFPANRSDHCEPRRSWSYLAGQLGLVALPPEPHALDGHLPWVDRALGADPLDALAHRGRLEAEVLGGRGKGERARLRPAIGVEPTDLYRPPSIRILVQDAALPDPHHGEPRRHRADGDGVGRDRDRQAAAPRCGGGHLGPRKGHGDHDLPAPEALEPDADVAVVEPEEDALLPGLAARDGDPGDSKGNRPGTEGHGLDANRAPQGRDQRALELGADQFWPAKPEEHPRRRDARCEEQDERRKPDETPPDETTPRRAQPGSSAPARTRS